MWIPTSTYRVQFNKDFRFKDALEIVPQLHRLGISHLYASPVFAARPGSAHGYDVTDPNRINQELGTREEFDRLADELHKRGMGLILDIVPNHMAVSADNAWWMDVLENGTASPYAAFFGIQWSEKPGTTAESKIFLPILGDSYGAVLEKGELKLSYDNGSFYLNYYENRFPVSPVTWDLILEPGIEPLLQDNPDLQLLMETLDRLPSAASGDWEVLERRTTDKEAIKHRIAEFAGSVPEFREHIEKSLTRMNGTPGDPASFDALHALLEQQAYRLAHWKVARDLINYRRFFDVSDLIGIRVWREEVMRATHELIFELLEQKRIDGIRIDHIDGLNDPLGYLERLPKDIYTVAEKILVGEERLPEDWPIQGTTGYDFLGYANALYVSKSGFDALDQFYRDVIGFTRSREEIEYDRKRLAERKLFPGEVGHLGETLASMAEDDRYARDLSARDITRALRELTACLDVYRTYTRDESVSDIDRQRVLAARERAEERTGSLISAEAFDYVSRVLTLQFRPGMSDDDKQRWVHFVRRWQQLTGPVMAKGVEDSTFYVYNLLVSLNEVGGIPTPVRIEQMHEFLSHRARHWPATMNGSSTHDTKRSEDVRARINVLSELHEEWTTCVREWREHFAGRRASVDDNEEYFIYQNLIGVWPLDEKDVPEFRERFRNYLTKAAREARENTDWIDPDEQHEADLHNFANLLFDDEHFQQSFQQLLAKVSWQGALNSLSQTLLKITAPGVPDFYRGTITWDFSLVDPDNRRPVDFAPLTDFSDPADVLLTTWRDGRVKVFVTETALAFRNAHKELFELGEYVPLDVRGACSENVFAFLRSHESSHVVVIVPRFMAGLSQQPDWGDTQVLLPEAAAQVGWKNKLTGERLQAAGALAVSSILSRFPVALLSCVA